MNMRWIKGSHSGNPDIEIPKFGDWNEPKFVVFFNR